MLNNVYFLIDGDNKQQIYPAEDKFIHLEKYCIENYLINFEVCALLASQTVDEIKALFLKLIQKEVNANGKIFIVIAHMLTMNHITEDFLAQFDASSLLKGICRELALNEDAYTKKYIEKSFEIGSEETILPRKVVDIIRDN